MKNRVTVGQLVVHKQRRKIRSSIDNPNEKIIVVRNVLILTLIKGL